MFRNIHLFKFNKSKFNIILFGLFVINSFNKLALAENLKYSKYQVEIIVFKRLNYKNPTYDYVSASNKMNKEIFYFSPLKYNKNKYISFKDHNAKMKFLVRESNILNQNSEYKIILQEATHYNLIPSEKSKKFLIKSDDKVINHELVDQRIENKDDDFIATLVITPIRNNTFNLAFDSNFNKFRLTKSAKIKSKEIYYFDHPAFGALIGIFEIKN